MQTSINNAAQEIKALAEETQANIYNDNVKKAYNNFRIDPTNGNAEAFYNTSIQNIDTAIAAEQQVGAETSALEELKGKMESLRSEAARVQPDTGAQAAQSKAAQQLRKSISTALEAKGLDTRTRQALEEILDNIDSKGEMGDNGKQENNAAGKLITEIKFKPSSGAILKASPGKTTTVIGSYDKDMQYILSETGNVKSTDFGPRDGGFNVLNVPDDIYKSMTREQFWENYNKLWLDNAIKRGDDIVLATIPEGDFLSYVDKITGKEVITGFGREYDYLLKKGYAYDAATNMMIRK